MNCEAKIKGVTFKKPPHTVIEETDDDDTKRREKDEHNFNNRLSIIDVDKYEQNLKRKFRKAVKKQYIPS